ncbi:hypothetical protein Tco_0696619 [Tanacetum coccineum]
MVVVENIVVEFFLESQNFGSRKEDTVVMVVVVDDTPIVIDKLVRVTFEFQKEDTVARKNLKRLTQNKVGQMYLYGRGVGEEKGFSWRNDLERVENIRNWARINGQLRLGIERLGALEWWCCYRLELEVSDETAQTVVVMFDETAKTVVKCLTGSIVGSEEQGDEETGLPPALANIVGTLHTLELKSNLYYEHANYESFTCWSVVLEEAPDESGSSGTLAADGNPKTGVFVPLTTTPSVTTPLNPGEHKKPRSKECHDSNGEESFVVDSKTKGSDVGCSSKAEKRRRYFEDYYSEDQYAVSIKEDTALLRCGLAGDLDNSTSNVLIPLDSWTSGLLVYRLPLSGTESRLRPYHFNYPERSLTMEEMLNKFIDERKREHEEMRAFIYDFQTNNELLFKERNNSLIELRFGVQELLNVINNVPTIDYDVKGVITIGGKTTTLDVHDNDTNVLPKEHVVVELEKPAKPNKNLTNDQPQNTCKL